MTESVGQDWVYTVSGLSSETTYNLSMVAVNNYNLTSPETDIYASFVTKRSMRLFTYIRYL